jgi:hypothetical protein
VDVKVVQESLSHDSSRITLDTYTQAASPAKRAAQAKVVSMVLGYSYKSQDQLKWLTALECGGDDETRT